MCLLSVDGKASSLMAHTARRSEMRKAAMLTTQKTSSSRRCLWWFNSGGLQGGLLSGNSTMPFSCLRAWNSQATSESSIRNAVTQWGSTPDAQLLSQSVNSSCATTGTRAGSSLRNAKRCCTRAQEPAVSLVDVGKHAFVKILTGRQLQFVPILKETVFCGTHPCPPKRPSHAIPILRANE